MVIQYWASACLVVVRRSPKECPGHTPLFAAREGSVCSFRSIFKKVEKLSNDRCNVVQKVVPFCRLYDDRRLGVLGHTGGARCMRVVQLLLPLVKGVRSIVDVRASQPCMGEFDMARSNGARARFRPPAGWLHPGICEVNEESKRVNCSEKQNGHSRCPNM